MRGNIFFAVCLFLGSVLLVAACGSSDANVSGRLSWEFDYRDWTDDAAKAEIRGCDNAPASPNLSAPAYKAITTVHVLIEDPDGQVPGIDQDYACEQGAGGKQLELRGLGARVYSLTLEAKDADGVVQYRLVEPEYDLTTVADNSYRLPAVVGEFSFIPTFDGSINCPANVTSLMWALFAKDNGVPANDWTTTGTQAPCEGDLAAEVWVRRVPTEPEATQSGAYLPTAYELRISAVDSGNNPVFCAQQAKNIDPGVGAPNSLPGSPNLTPGACL